MPDIQGAGVWILIRLEVTSNKFIQKLGWQDNESNLNSR